MSKGLIILVEDDDLVRKFYRNALTERGYVVMPVPSAEKALDLFYTSRPKLILLDINLPGMSGIDLCKRARSALGTDVPIVFQTADKSAKTLRLALTAGGNDYIVKGETLDNVLKRVDFWVKSGGRFQSPHFRERALKDVDYVLDFDLENPPENLSSSTDPTVRAMSGFVTRARMQKPNFGQTIEQKLFLLGYVTGVVDYWSIDRPGVQAFFELFLEAVLKETNTLSEAEITYMITSLEELERNINFSSAKKRGALDAKAGAGQGSSFKPMGLIEWEDVVEEGLD